MDFLDITSSIHIELTITVGQDVSWDNVGISFRSSIKKYGFNNNIRQNPYTIPEYLFYDLSEEFPKDSKTSSNHWSLLYYYFRKTLWELHHENMPI